MLNFIINHAHHEGSVSDVIIHALIDSLKVFIVVFLVYVVLSFIETKLTRRLEKENRLAPFYGAATGLIPQCGVSVVATDLYLKSHLTMGTLIAVYLACSDEAVPILLSSKESALMVIPLLLIKLLYGFLIGFIIDLIMRKEREKVATHNHEDHEHADLEKVHVGCCHHDIDNEEENKWHKHLVHPLLHSLKIFIFIFIFNLIFGFIMHYNEEALINFIQTNKYLTPLFAVLIGLIPNCASSILISKLYIVGSLGFGALVGGLSVNAGLGLLYLFKDRKHLKKAFLILGILILSSLVIGYATSFIMMFK